ncbi:hypothetical protein IQ251_15980, partial [Saccharopolyspora sp. HNM0983]
MARDEHPDDPVPGLFGRFDPFVWLPVAPLLVLGLVIALIGVPLLGWPMVVLSLLVLGFDAWINRPARYEERRRLAALYERGDDVDRPRSRPVPRSTGRPRGDRDRDELDRAAERQRPAAETGRPGSAEPRPAQQPGRPAAGQPQQGGAQRPRPENPGQPQRPPQPGGPAQRPGGGP